MSDLFADGVILPMILLLVLGWFVPQGLAKIMPEGVAALFILAGVAFCILFALSAAIFAWLYASRGAPLDAFSTVRAVAHFGRLGLLSGLFWLPVMILSVASLPRKWVKETW